MKISEDDTIQEQVFSMPKDTYFSAVISHAYYGIFYMAKAYLLTKNIKTKPPEEHKKTYEEFEKLVQQGIIDVELLKIYRKMMLRADTLLKIFGQEKGKRGRFTYRTLPQANKDPAQESLSNAETFFKHLYNLTENK
jgi:uncharacterized protein (UPF0332 family)